MVDVLIIIISFKSVEDIALCLAALEGSTYRDFRIFIVENGGEAAYEKLRQALPTRLACGQSIAAVLAPGNLGYAGGINFALDHAEPADAYWILNPDAEPAATALKAMLDRLERGDCSAVGHDLILPNGQLASRAGGRWRAWSARAISMGHGSDPNVEFDPNSAEEKMDYIVGASMLITQGFLDRVGRMREDYFLYCEETEWCLRATRMGERLGYAPAAVAIHRHGTSTGGGGVLKGRSRTAIYLSERNRILVTRDMFAWRLPVAATLALVHWVLRYTRARAWRQLSYALSGWIAGLRNERGKPAWWTEA